VTRGDGGRGDGAACPATAHHGEPSPPRSFGVGRASRQV